MKASNLALKVCGKFIIISFFSLLFESSWASTGMGEAPIPTSVTDTKAEIVSAQGAVCNKKCCESNFDGRLRTATNPAKNRFIFKEKAKSDV